MKLKPTIAAAAAVAGTAGAANQGPSSTTTPCGVDQEWMQENWTEMLRNEMQSFMNAQGFNHRQGMMGDRSGFGRPGMMGSCRGS